MSLVRVLPLLLALALPLGAQTTIIYVDADSASGARNGTSWPNAYPEVLDALANATAPAEIWVAEGTYRSSQNLDRSGSMVLVDGVDLYGGFDGTESLREERDPDAYPTILTGDLQLDDDSGGSNAENAYHVLHCPSGAVALDGFTIHGGNTTGDAVNPNGGAAYGAGSLTFTDCLFKDNTAATHGGATYQAAGDGAHSFSDCRFEGNVAGEHGGAISCYNLLHLVDCSFSGNEADGSGGGVYLDFAADATSTILRCEFTGNSSSDTSGFDFGGGGLYLGASLTTALEQCTFTDNLAEHLGGGLFSQKANSIKTCLFKGNRAIGHPQAYGGGASGRDSSHFINCLFLGNIAGYRGGAIGIQNKGGEMLNCTFQGNSAAHQGGAVSLSYTDTFFENCLLWNNAADGSTTTPSASYHNSQGFGQPEPPNATYSLLQGWNLAGTGNIDGTVAGNDPLFVSPVDPLTAPHLIGDLRLQLGSPALDAGDNSLNAEPLDLAGLARIQNTTIDLGAHEAVPAAEIAVQDADGTDLTDNGPARDLGLLRLEDLNAPVDFTVENLALVDLTSIAVTASGPNGPEVSVSTAPPATLVAHASAPMQITLALNSAGPFAATLAVASNDADENPFDIPLTAVIASDLADGDSDGLSDYQELSDGDPNTDPGNPDTDGDGVNDGPEVNLAAYGFLNGQDDSALLAALQSDAPNLGLYTESNLQSLAMGRPVLSRDSVSGNFTIATGLLQSPDLDTTPFAPLINYTPTYNPGTGELLLEFAPPSPDAHFFQIFGKAP